MTAMTMYERVGGEAVLRRLCEKFHARVVADPVLSPLFAYSGESHVDHLTTFLAEMFGGPARYSSELGGIGGLYDAHLGLDIQEDQRARFVDLLMDAAAEVGLPADDGFRTRLRAHLEAGSHFSMKFSKPDIPAEKPAFPPVEPWTWPDSAGRDHRTGGL